MYPERRDFLINEYSILNSCISNIWTLFFTVLAGGLGLFGFLVKQMHEAEGGEIAAFYAVSIILVPTALSLALGQLHYATYFFYFRILEIAREFRVTDSWSKWERIVKKDMDLMNVVKGQPEKAGFKKSSYTGYRSEVSRSHGFFRDSKMEYGWLRKHLTLLAGMPRSYSSFPLVIVLYFLILATVPFVANELGWGYVVFFSIVMAPVNLWLTYSRLVPYVLYDKFERKGLFSES